MGKYTFGSCVPSKALDQPTPLYSFIWCFSGCSLGSKSSNISSGGKWRLTRLCRLILILDWHTSPKVRFLPLYLSFQTFYWSTVINYSQQEIPLTHLFPVDSSIPKLFGQVNFLSKGCLDVFFPSCFVEISERNILRCLGLHCLLMSLLWDARLKWVKKTLKEEPQRPVSLQSGQQKAVCVSFWKTDKRQASLLSLQAGKHSETGGWILAVW